MILRQNTQIREMKIGIELVKVSPFADNAVIYPNDRPTQFKYVFIILEVFGSKFG